MNRKTYRQVFFDLDKTLWDFETNSLETFRDIFSIYKLAERGVDSFDRFIERYNQHNLMLWEFYRKGEIAKEALNIRRFSLTLHEFGITDDLLSSSIANEYVSLSPTKTNLFPDTYAILKYLGEKYKLHIITNGFEEVQYKKLNNAGLMKYFASVITSEDAGVRKPDPGIFEYALQRSGAKSEESLMIGDDEEVDILGALKVGMDQVLVDYKGEVQDSKATYRICKLSELFGLL